MSDPPKCPQCGAPIAADAPGGQCLRCLLGLGLARAGAEEPDEITPPEIADDEFPGYRILEKLGEGGCGVVWRARQTGALNREVAIKVIKLGMDTRQVIDRFEAERRTLALMDHPHIARVFDAGTSGRGHPFFVMELVAGETITHFCDRKGLSIPQRLELFLQVCDAVRHAHLKGIIHRDLKPSNILVAETDGSPVPKVIDFGIAKAIDHQRLADRTIYTAFDQFVGTPAYMSPEQAGLTGEDIDARSDIYSLGVLLYELLTGRPPFEPERLRKAAIHEICRIIREEEPSLPSTRLTTLSAEEIDTAARQRTSPPKHLVTDLRGDLDGIVMKALEKNRDRRYDTASELSADILRHLHHEPVTARPPGFLYRFRKFARRNKLVLASGTLVLCALVGGLGVSLWMGHKEKQARLLLERRAYLTDINSACRTAFHPGSNLRSTMNLLENARLRHPEYRNWEWYFLNGLCHQERLTIHADPVSVSSVSWSSDGKLLATGGSGESIKLWDALTGMAAGTLGGHVGLVRVVAWAPVGSVLASSGNDKTIRIWDTATTHCRILGEHTKPATSLAWSPDGTLLASGCGDRTVKIWDTRQTICLRTLTASRSVRAVCWTPDGANIIACGDGGLHQCWQAATGRELWCHIAAVGGNIHSATCSPDGARILSGGAQKSVNFRDAATGVNLYSRWDNQSTVNVVTWSPDGKQVAAGTLYDGCITVRDPDLGGAILRSFRSHSGSILSLAWAPNSTSLASACSDGTVKIWHPSARNPSIVSFLRPEMGTCLAWSPDGTRLATGGQRTDGWINDLSLGGAAIALDGGLTGWTRSIAWNADGSLLASASDTGLRVWDFAKRSTVWTDLSSFKSLTTVAWDERRGHIIAGGGHGFSIWNASDGTLIHTTPLAPGVVSLALNPDASRIAVADNSGTIGIFDESHVLIRSLRGDPSRIYSIAWHPGGTLLAVGGADSSAEIWDTRTGEIVHSLFGHGGPVQRVAWNPDGTSLVTGGSDATVRLWDTETGLEVCLLDHPGTIINQITGLDWAATGNRIGLADGEGNVVILDATPGHRAGAGQPVSDFPSRDAKGHQETIRSLLIYLALVEPISQDDSDALRRLAWIRATSIYPEVRDGPKAVRFAEAASREVGGQNAGILSILAAAHAECGDFDKAISIQKQAISLISSDARRSAFAAELRHYEAHQPTRDESW